MSEYGLPVAFRADDNNIKSLNNSKEIQSFLSQEFNLMDLDHRFVPHL